MRRKKVLIVAALVLAGLCVLCVGASLAMSALGLLPTRTPTLSPTGTAVPTFTVTPASTRKRKAGPTVTLVPERSPVPTVAPSATLAPTVAGAGEAPCNCSGPDLDCKDFSSQRQAQACFDFCGGTAHDVFGLDKDGDGRVCEK